MRILVVEDDTQLAEMLTEALTERHYVVNVAVDGEEAWNCVKVGVYDLVVLDITLPKLDGVSLCQKLRSHNSALPILMLTARDTLADKIIGLDAGADDYMTKPFEMPELMARIRAMLRRGSVTASANLCWGGLHLNTSTYEVTYADKPLHLTPREYTLLELLVSNGRRVLTRGGIIERIWSLEDPPSEETVKSHIKGLRHKLREVGAPDDFIETVYGLGYRLKQL
ncbi:response regulator transcription factor [Aetokthonos hydrillicola Thurmond2011]|jgi:DNA-binding response OmpR family regulator|uniref:Response regulator transcription factor n=1 Tax=Aetokthonos hydrillicola Thurmond2011 TaxID=2712845 RepID=A0AAP5IDH1_9CYAN|nr:response regulator transcription factor [Aetokthonos hydrillicola]MBO3458365.1 response regulator transcription factor [Aetokthonos hydrillicola CCALA 1050]MBW4586096.1 response regulator transcription factor [Aetokthonos hydrillicola CCALA 1050]MDR9897703.1 response regulator transcription factor [Aetokthonos hydrillicola Thurmond2011]